MKRRRVVAGVVWVLILLAATALTLGLLRVADPGQPYEPDPDQQWQPSQSGGRARVAEGSS